MGYKWLETTTAKGKVALMGPYNSDARAQSVRDKLERDGKIWDLPTRDTVKATRMIKAHKAEKMGIDKGTANISHTIKDPY